MRKNSIKNNRLNGEVQKVLAEIIRKESKDPRIHPMTTVMETIMSPDLKSCKAYISVLGNEEDIQNTMKGLQSAEGYIRSLLAKQMNLRYTPVITFISDQSVEYGINMMKLIDEVTADLQKEENEEQESD